MREEQKLYPQLIYRINNALSELKTEVKKLSDFSDNLFIAPSVLNPYSRTFNWLLVAEGRWNLSNGLMSEIQSKIKNSENEWNQFKEEFKKIEEVKSIADAIRSIENSENLNPEEYHSTLLFLYQSYPINNKEYFDGIIYQNLIRRAKNSDGKNHKIDYAKAELLIEKRKNNELYPPVSIVFYCDGKQSGPKRTLSQVKNNTKISNNNFHKNYFLPFFGKYEETFDPKTFLVLKPEHFSKFQFLYIRPFYDALYGQYGNICGILTIFFSEPEKRKSFIKSKANKKLIARLSSYVEEIKRAALFEILQQPIEDSTDFLKHYIECLPMLQDWERVMVWEITKEKRKEAELIYCYKRYKNDKWKECEPSQKCRQECKVNFDKLKEKVITAEKKHLTTKEVDIQLKNSKHIVLLEKILTRKLIPELYEEDEIKYKNIRLIYEYPSYTIFPDDEAEKYPLGLFYERQQIDLLRQLAIKRKVMLETIRHGTRAAVAAIMGRNMSHNIGSHVLSRLSEYEDNELKTGTEKSKALFIYLQRRMDFIAQISTTSPSWTVDIKWGEILEDFKEQTYLLDNIAKFKNLDSKSIKITYENNDKDKYVAIPTGLVGCHAFYSILENVIRNSAKYGYVKDGLEFNILLKDYDNEYFEVCITDNCKNANYNLVGNLNNMFKENLIDNEGGLSGTFWGIKEEKISSSYLRLIAAENIDYQFEESLKYKPIIEVVTENCNIQYNILLIKPRKALIISENIPSDKTIYKDYGIDFLSDIGCLKSYVSTKKVNHKFLVLPQKINTVDKDWLRENCNYLPIRSIKLDLSKNNSPDDLYNKIWEKYFQDLNKEILNQKIVVRWGDDGGFNESIKKNLNDSSFIHIWHTINVVDFDNFILFDHKSDNNETGLCSKASLRVPFDSADALGYLLQSDLTQLKFLRYEFLESFNTKVAIVDNRVWEERSKQIRIKKCNNVAIIKDVWKKMGVEFFDHNEAIADFKNFVENREQGYKYLIFHQGEIDEIKKNIKNDFWQNWKKLCEKFDHVIIDTGRGVPDQAKKDNLRWVQYSSIQDCIINQIKNNIGIAKYNLIKLLSSLKRD